MTKTEAVNAAAKTARDLAATLPLADNRALDYDGRRKLAREKREASETIILAGVPEKWHGDVRTTFEEKYQEHAVKAVRYADDAIRRFNETFDHAMTLTAAKAKVVEIIESFRLRGLEWRGGECFEIKRAGANFAQAELRVRYDLAWDARMKSPEEGDTRYYTGVSFRVEVRTSSNAHSITEANVIAKAYADAIEVGSEIETFFRNTRVIAKEGEY